MATNRSTGKNRKKRRLKKGRIALVIVVFTALVALVVLSLTVFFPVRKIRIQEDTRYTAEEIVKKSGVTVGDNLFLVNSGSIEERLCRALPYIRSVDLERSLPDTLLLKVSEQEPEYAFLVKEGYLIVGGGRALELVEEMPDGLTLVEYAPQYKIGEKVSLKQNEEMFARLIAAVADSGLKSITRIAFEDASKVTLIYDDRITLELGSIENVEKKLKKAVQIIAAVDEDYNGHAEGTVRLQYDDSYFERGSQSSESTSSDTGSETEKTPET